jgi:hypothetical protein
MYPLFDKIIFSGLVPVLLAWPWIDYLPSSLFFVMVGRNDTVIYFAMAILSFLMSSLFLTSHGTGRGAVFEGSQHSFKLHFGDG